MPPRTRTTLLLLTLFATALALRLWGIGWGLPYVEHPDEPSILGTALRMVRNGDLNPHRFDKPSLFFSLLAAATELHLRWGMANGLYGSAQELPASVGLFTTTPGLFLANRAVTALLGALTVPLLYLLGRAMWGARTGLLAALALTLAHFHLEHSAYITTDVPSALGVTLAMLGAWRVVVRGDWWAYALAGIGCGIAAGTKYNAAVIVLALPLAHWLRHGRAAFGKPLLLLAGAAAATLLAFVLATPYALLDAPAFFGGLLRLDDNYGGDSIALGDRAELLVVRTGDYATFFWDRGLLPTGCLLLLAGLPLLIRRSPRQVLLLGSVVLAELVGLALYKVHFMRNLLAVFPLILLLAAAAAVALSDLARPRLRPVMLLVLSLVLLLPQASRSLGLLRYVTQPHTMAVAAESLRALPQGMRSAVEQHPVQWAGSPLVFPVERLTDHDAAWYRANGFRYLLANDDHREPRKEAGSYDALLAAATVVERYPERSLGLQPGPGGLLLDLGVDEAAMTFTRRPARFGDSIALLGYEAAPGEPRTQATPLEPSGSAVLPGGAGLQINLYWRALAPPERDYTLFVHLLNTAGERVAQRDLPLRHEDYPSSHWQQGELVIDRADTALPPLPPGQYRVVVGLYDPATGQRLRSNPPSPDDAFDLLTIRIE